MSETLRLVPREQAEANQSVVETLERVLEKAKNGELAGVAIVGLHTDGTNYSMFSGTSDRLKLIGMLEWVHFRMLQQYAEE